MAQGNRGRIRKKEKERATVCVFNSLVLINATLTPHSTWPPLRASANPGGPRLSRRPDRPHYIRSLFSPLFLHHQLNPKSKIKGGGRRRRRKRRRRRNGEHDRQGEGVRGGQDRAYTEAGGVAHGHVVQGGEPRRRHAPQRGLRHQPLQPPPPCLRALLHPRERRKGDSVGDDGGSRMDSGGGGGDQARGAGEAGVRLPDIADEGHRPRLGHRLPPRRRPHHRPPRRRQLHHPPLHRGRAQAPHPQRHVLIILILHSLPSLLLFYPLFLINNGIYNNSSLPY